MKKSQLIAAILVIALGGVGIFYAQKQNATMNLLVATHGGGALVDDMSATGLRKFSRKLVEEDISAQRAAALEKADKSLMQMKADRSARDNSKSILEASQSTLSEKQSALEATQAQIAEIEKNIAALMIKLKDLMPDRFGSESEIAAAMDKLKEVAAEQAEERERIEAELKEKQTIREALVQKVAGLQVDLNKVAAVNEEFFDNYCQNDDEYTIVAVNPTWKFVVFKAPSNSRIVPGDATPLIVKRDGVKVANLRVVSNNNGQIIAEYDPKLLPAGITLQVGDKVFRLKPLGS